MNEHGKAQEGTAFGYVAARLQGIGAAAAADTRVFAARAQDGVTRARKAVTDAAARVCGIMDVVGETQASVVKAGSAVMLKSAAVKKAAVEQVRTVLGASEARARAAEREAHLARLEARLAEGERELEGARERGTVLSRDLEDRERRLGALADSSAEASRREARLGEELQAATSRARALEADAAGERERSRAAREEAAGRVAALEASVAERLQAGAARPGRP